MTRFLIKINLLIPFILSGLAFAGPSPRKISGNFDRADTAAININFDNNRLDDLNSVHKTSTETITGVKHFDYITASTITLNKIEVEDLVVTSSVAIRAVLDMNSNKIVNLSNGTVSTDAVAFGQLITNNIVATSTNDNATAGDMGETKSSDISSATNTPATTVRGDLTSISLTAGDWIVSGYVYFALNGATCTAVEAAISSSSGDTTAGTTFGITRIDGYPPTGNTGNTIYIGPVRISLSSTTTYYLKYQAIFSAGQPQARGHIFAVRPR